jgi:hypothetical protein
VYATFDGHRNNDDNIYAYVSEDYGESWKSIVSNLPEGHTLNVIREHPRRESLLVAGGEFGAYVSFDRGSSWHRFEGRFPTVPVDDIAIHPRDNDLIMGTHGRSIYVLDDMGPLEELTDAVVDSDLHLFEIRDAVSYRIYNHKGNTGHKRFVAPNPPDGALIHYYLKSEPEEKDAVKVSILDSQGDTIRELTGTQEVGLNRINWDLRHKGPLPPTGETGFRGPPPGPLALTGDYTIKVEVGDLAASRPVRLEEDPRITISAADRRAQFDTIQQLSGLIAAMDQGHKKAAELKSQVSSLQESLKNQEPPETVTTAVGGFAEKVDDMEKKLSRDGGLGRIRYPQQRPLYSRLTRLYGTLNGYTEAPSAAHREHIDAYSGELRGLLDQLNEVITEDVANLNRILQENAVPRITSGSRVDLPPT